MKELGTKPHPAAFEALRYLSAIPLADLMLYLESFSSCAIEGNDVAEYCAQTLDLFLKGEKLGDRYVLGLAWMIRDIRDKQAPIAQEVKRR